QGARHARRRGAKRIGLCRRRHTFCECQVIAMSMRFDLLSSTRPVLSALLALGLAHTAASAQAQSLTPPAPRVGAPLTTHSITPPVRRVASPATTQSITSPQSTAPAPQVAPVQSVAPSPSIPSLKPASTLISTLTFADLGFGTGIRFANLGGRREI